MCVCVLRRNSLCFGGGGEIMRSVRRFSGAKNSDGCDSSRPDTDNDYDGYDDDYLERGKKTNLETYTSCPYENGPN